MKHLTKIFINLSFRALGVAAKFILILDIAKKLPLNDLGTYNLIASSIGVAVFVVGFEFNLFANREFTKKLGHDPNPNILSQILLNSFAFYILAYLVIFPLLLIYFFGFKFIQLQYLPIFSILLIFDHLSQELCRILAARFNSIYYNFLFFIKNGLWVYVLFVYVFLTKAPINLTLVFSTWAVFTILSFILGVIKVYKLRLLRLKHFSLDTKWIAKGIQLSLPFFLSTIAFRILEINDRFFIQSKLGMNQLGIYAFYIGLASVPYTLVTSAISVQYIPHIVHGINTKNRPELKKSLLGFGGIIILIYLFFAVGAYFIIGKLLHYLNKDELNNCQTLFWTLTIATFFLSLQQLGQAILYALHKDRILLITIAGAAILDVMINLFYTGRFGVYIPALALLFSAIILMTVRMLLAVKYVKLYEGN